MTEQQIGGLFSQEETPKRKTMKEVEQTENQSHQADSSAEEFAIAIANYCVNYNVTVKRAIAEMIKNLVCSPNFKMHIGGSFFKSYLANPLDAMVSRGLRVYFGSSVQMIRGNAIHLGRELALKHKIETGELLPRRECNRAMKLFIKEKWKYLNPEKEKNASMLESFKEACYGFRLYYKELKNDECIEVETTYKEHFPSDIFYNPAHVKHFIGSATFDGLIRKVVDEEEVFVMIDTKTTTKPISGSVEKTQTHLQLLERKTALLDELTKYKRIIVKLPKTEKEYKEAVATLEDVETKLLDARANGGKTRSLEKRVEKWTKEVPELEENLNLLRQAEKEASIIESEIEELEEVLAPLETIYKEEKKKADLKVCQKAHNEQLAYCSLLEYFKTGRLVKRVKIENLICKKVKIGDKFYNRPEYQVFEWDLDDEILEEMQETVLSIIHSIEMIMDGADPMVIFRHNPETYYGSDIDALIDDIKEMVKIQKDINK